MNKKKAIEILRNQQIKLKSVTYKEKDTWVVQTASYIKLFLGEDSKEYEFIKDFKYWTAMWIPATPQELQSGTDQRKPTLSSFIDNCIETINNKGLYRRRKSYIFNETWAKNNPVFFEIIKWAIPVIGAAILGYFIRK